MEKAVDSGRMLGAILLVAGSCIGAGMLALPIVTGMAGFLPSVVMFVVAWAFMTTTGLLLLEVNIWLGERISIVTMAHHTLGKIGQVLSWVLFCFLFYLILVAYIAGSGGLVSDFFAGLTGFRMEAWIGSVIFTLIFGFQILMGTRAVDWVNRLLMIGLVISYVILIGLGVNHVKPALLRHENWEYTWAAAPIVVIAFGFHNMIPSVTHYLKRNISKLRWTVIIGSLIPLVVYLLWEWIILGIIPVQGEEGFADSLVRGDLVTLTLRRVVGRSWIGVVAQYFAFFAMVTSFVAQGLSLVHFLSDGLRVSPTATSKVWLTLLALTPPFILAMVDPTIFIVALEIAGAYSAVVLFGIFPALMVWVGRYRERGITHRLVPGGRPLLAVVIVVSLVVIVAQILNQSGLIGGNA